MKEKKTSMISFRVDSDTKEALAQKAKDFGMSLSEYITFAGINFDFSNRLSRIEQRLDAAEVKVSKEPKASSIKDEVTSEIIDYLRLKGYNAAATELLEVTLRSKSNETQGRV